MKWEDLRQEGRDGLTGDLRWERVLQTGLGFPEGRGLEGV